MQYFYNQVNLIKIFVYISVINSLYGFNIEELKGLNYEIDISETPVKNEETSYPAVYITSRNGQDFQCLLPQLQEEESSEKEPANEKDTDVLELLKPLKTKPCLSKTKDWWTYEFCYGHYVKQFHVDEGEILGQVITLGLFDSDYDWNNETDQEKFKHTKQKYHSQYYTNGSKCDLTGQPRNAEVRLYCEEDASDYIYRVDEPATCNYVITIHTGRLCSHPLLKPLPSSKAHPITCHPLLNEEQYSKYLEKVNEERSHAEEKLSQWLINQQERLQFIKNENLLKQDKSDDALSAEKRMKAIKENYETVRSIIMKEYNKELEKVKAIVPPEQFITIKEDVKKQFDAILDDLKTDFESLGVAEENFGDLKSGISTLSEKIDKAVKGVAKAQDKLNKAKTIISDATAEDAEESLDDAPKKDTDEKESTLSTDILKDTNRDQSQADVDDDEDKLQVRIRRLERKSSDAGGKLHEMDFEQRKRLEQIVKERLEKSGLDIEGKKIEVKIITAGYYDNDGKDLDFLSDEETDQFQNMIMALLTGQHEAVQEMKRQKKLEENYKFSWNSNEETENKED